VVVVARRTLRSTDKESFHHRHAGFPSELNQRRQPAQCLRNLFHGSVNLGAGRLNVPSHFQVAQITLAGSHKWIVAGRTKSQHVQVAITFRSPAQGNGSLPPPTW